MKFEVGHKLRCIEWMGFTTGKIYSFVSRGEHISLIDDGGCFREGMSEWSIESWYENFSECGISNPNRNKIRIKR